MFEIGDTVRLVTYEEAKERGLLVGEWTNRLNKVLLQKYGESYFEISGIDNYNDEYVI